MMGTQTAPAQLFYDFDLERHVPTARVEPSARLFLSGQPVWIAARATHGLVHFGGEALRSGHLVRREILTVRRLCRSAEGQGQRK